MRRTSAVLLLGLLTAGSAGGCGFVNASAVSHTKPSGFVLRGYVSTPVPAGDARVAGAACAAPTGLPDIAAGTRVKVIDPVGNVIGLGDLVAGVIARSSAVSSCDFAFEIRAVPGGVASYSIAVGAEPAQQFAADQLRQDKPAIIQLNG